MGGCKKSRIFLDAKIIKALLKFGMGDKENVAEIEAVITQYQ